jgi:hypothetical protein
MAGWREVKRSKAVPQDNRDDDLLRHKYNNSTSPTFPSIAEMLTDYNVFV